MTLSQNMKKINMIF